MAMHVDQVFVSVDVVRSLVARQFPRWAGLEVRAVGSAGTENALFRLGDHAVARLPLRGGDVAAARRQVIAEAGAARELHGRTRFATPRPLAIGAPGPGYPLPWSVQTWVPGASATPDHPGSVAFARDLAALVGDLRAVGTRGRTFGGTGRGGDLPAHDAWLQTCFSRSEGLLDVPALRRLGRLRTLPRTGPGRDGALRPHPRQRAGRRTAG